MKVRELVDILEQVYIAQMKILEYRESLMHGGNEETLERKNARLRDEEAALEGLLDTELNDVF